MKGKHDSSHGSKIPALLHPAKKLGKSAEFSLHGGMGLHGLPWKDFARNLEVKHLHQAEYGSDNPDEVFGPKDSCRLGRALDEKHARHQRATWKMVCKKRKVRGQKL